jgi:hypothetical protein
LLQDYIQAYEGKLTDSEADVWYPRWSAKKVREHRFPSTEWKGQQISYYGRQKTLAEEGIAETIIENIKKVFSDC